MSTETTPNAKGAALASLAGHLYTAMSLISGVRHQSATVFRLRVSKRQSYIGAGFGTRTICRVYETFALDADIEYTSKK